MSPIPAVVFIWNTASQDDYTGKEDTYTSVFFQGTFDKSDISVGEISEHDQSTCDEVAPISQSPGQRNVWSRQDSPCTIYPPQLPRRSMDIDGDCKENAFLESLGIRASTFAKTRSATFATTTTTSSSRPRRMRRIESDITEQNNQVDTILSQSLDSRDSLLMPRMPVRRTSIQVSALSA